jgi:hypothetical protein
MPNKTGFGIMILSAFLIFASNGNAQEQAPAPVYNEGDIWVFRVTEHMSAETTQGLDGNYKVIYKSGKFIVAFPGGKKPESKQNLAPVKGMLDEPNDKKQLLQFPLAIGKKWTAAYEVESAVNSRRRHRNAETKVTGAAQITTPAGTFRAFKIERYETTSGGRKKTSGDTIGTYTYYYSPEVRGLVKLSYESEGGAARSIELVKYVPAR